MCSATNFILNEWYYLDTSSCDMITIEYASLRAFVTLSIRHYVFQPLMSIRHYTYL